VSSYNNINNNKIVFRAGILIILFLFVGLYLHYTAAVKFYRPFYITVSDTDSLNISDLFEIYGVSYFGDTIDLYLKDGKFHNCDNCYFVDIGMTNTYLIKDTLNVKYFDTEGSLFENIINNNNSDLFNGYKGYGLVDKISSVGFIKILTIILILVCFVTLVLLIKTEVILLYIKRKWIESRVLCIISLLFTLIGSVVIILCLFLTVKKDLADLPDFNNSIIVEHHLESKYDGYVITIEDTSGLGLEFIFSLNDNFWFSADSLLSSVRNINVDEVFQEDEEIVQAWKFVSNNTYHRMPKKEFVCNDVLDKPSLLLNSSGYGICSNRTYALCVILENMGYKTRIWNVKDFHAFLEVFNGNKWLMLDPDYGLLLLTEEGQIASLDDIQFDNSLVPVMSGKNNFICNTGNMIDTFPIRLKNIYKNDTLSSYCMLTDKTLDNMYFKLPAGTKLTFPIYIDSLDTYVIEVCIPGFYVGEVRIPLLVNSVVNNENKLTDSLSKCGVLYDDFYIYGEDIVISALINPLLFIPKKNGSLSFCYYTNNSWYPEIKILDKSDDYDADLFKVISYWSEFISGNKSNYLEKSKEYLQKLNLPIIEWKDIEKVVEFHYYGKEYPVHKMEILKRVFLSMALSDEQFFYWINCPENIALILIILDKSDNDNYLFNLKSILNC
jgi:hypothetical protein